MSRHLGSALVLLGAWAAAAVLVDPRADVPLIDDWTYAFSVERILAGEGFTVSAWSSTFPAAQIWWGTLFAAIGGFSYTALRLSTLVLGAAGTVGFFGLLRGLGCQPAGALLGAATLFLYPVGFVLSFTFMTDVPFVTAAIFSLWALTVGLSRARLPPVALGLLIAVVAFLIRPVAIALPAALLVVAWVHPASPLRGRAAALAVAALVVMAGATIVAGRLWPYAGEGGLAYRIERLRYIFLVSPVVYAEAFCSMLAHLGLAALPALVATAPRLGRWPWRTAGLVFIAAALVSLFAPEQVSALKPGAIWSAEEIGAAAPLLQGALPRSAVREAAAVAATAAGLFAGTCLLARVARGVRQGGALRTPAWTCVGAFGVVSAGLCFALWFFYDRYYLPLVPVAIALALTGRPAVAPLRLRPAALLLAALAFLDVTGTRDMLVYARAVSAAAARLHGAGIPYHQVDAGYVENGWRLHAHPENLPPGARPERDVPHVTSAPRLPFVIANSPLAGYRIREEITLPTWWASSDHLYVLEE